MSSKINPISLSFWERTKVTWIILICFVTGGIIYYTYQARQLIRYRRAQRRFGLQRPQPVYVVARGSELSLAAPRYERHVNDQTVPLGVKFEQRGRYIYVVEEENGGPPKYEVLVNGSS